MTKKRAVAPVADLLKAKRELFCRFVGYGSGLSDIFRDNMLITNVTYSLNQAIIDVEIIHAGLLDVQSKQGQSIADISSGGLDVPATTP